MNNDPLVDLNSEMGERESIDLEYTPLYHIYDNDEADEKEIELISASPALRKLIVDHVCSTQKMNRGPYNHNEEAVRQMLRDRMWYILTK